MLGFRTHTLLRLAVAVTTALATSSCLTLPADQEASPAPSASGNPSTPLPKPSPTPSPSATVTPTPRPNSSPTPTPTRTPSPTPTPNAAPSPTPTTIPAGATYYFSTSDGDDTRTAAQARNSSTPWKSITKLNSIFSTLAPGDFVLFKSGDTFYGPLVATASGSAGKPISFGAYGSGKKPVLSGFTQLTNWTSLGNGIYQSSCANCPSTANLVFVDGVNTAMGRWPNRNATNKGWRVISSHNGNVSFSDNTLTSTPNWAGGEAVLRTSPWTISRNPITSHSGTRINFTATSGDLPIDGYGYFIQNHPSTLDTFGEWYFDRTTKNLKMYFGSAAPGSSVIQIASVDTLIDLHNRSYINFTGISFQGSNSNTFNLLGTNSITIQDSELRGTGDIAITGDARNMRIENCLASDSNNAFISVDGGADGAIIRGNTIQNTGILPGMGIYQYYTAISFSYSNNVLIEKNRLMNTGYNGIHFLFGNNIDINSNVVDGFNIEKDDGAGIYTWNGVTNATEFTGNRIRNNIVINGKSAPEARSEKDYTPANGIYMDDNAGGVEISGNTVANNAGSGFFLHNAHNLLIQNNLSYNNGPTAPYSYGYGQMMILANSSAALMRNITMTGNQFVARSPNQIVLKWDTDFDDVREFGVVDNNIYARPASDSVMSRIVAGGMEYFFSLAAWRTYSGFDLSSKGSPANVTDPNALRFEVNDTAVSKVILLDRRYVAVNGTVYTASITLPPYSSVVLIPQ